MLISSERCKSIVHAACLAALGWIAACPAAAQDRARIDIGELALSFDPGTWKVASAGGRLTASCLRHRRCGDLGASGVLSDDPPSACSDAALRKAARSRLRTSHVQLSGIVLHMVSIDTGCRNLVPPRIVACVAHDGRLYRFDTGARGCRYNPGIGGGRAVIELLEGLSARVSK